MSQLRELFSKPNKKLIGYVPAGYPNFEGAKQIIKSMVSGGVDAIEVGFPYSDPVMDGPTIQAAADQSLAQGTSAADVFDALNTATSAGIPAVVMTYWNPIEKYGVEKFASSIKSHGGSGVITPDLTIEESDAWQSAVKNHEINPIYVVAPSTSDSRLPQVTSHCGGFVYAASIMGVTGARASVSDVAQTLVERARNYTDLPISVGLGVSTPEQAEGVAKYANGVIVGSAFINAVAEAPDFESGLKAVIKLASELKAGISK